MTKYADRFGAGTIPIDSALYRPTKSQFLMLQRAIGGETDEAPATKEIGFTFRAARELIYICRGYLGLVSGVEASPQIKQFDKAAKRAYYGSNAFIQYGRNNRTWAKDPQQATAAEDELDFQFSLYLDQQAPARRISTDHLVTDEPMPEVVRRWLDEQNLSIRTTAHVVGLAGEALGNAFDHLSRPQDCDRLDLPMPDDATDPFLLQIKQWATDHELPTRIKGGKGGQQPMELCWFTFRLLLTFPVYFPNPVYHPQSVTGVMEKYLALGD